MEPKPQRLVETAEDGRDETSRWDNKVDFFMAAISSTIGLGNLWRFPYIAYRNGGGAFLIPFMLMIIIIGFPMVTIDLALGQYAHRGPVGVWNLCPLFQGIGWSMCIMNFLCTTYYVMLMAYAIFYVTASFSPTLPWTTCNNTWNTASCVDETVTCEQSGGSWLNESCIPTYNLTDTGREITAVPTYASASFPSEEYYNNYVLGLSSGLDDMGGVQWHLSLPLLTAWVLIVIGLSRGTKSWGKLSYLTALLPYIVMLALLIQACMRTGATYGILYFITPIWNRLADMQVWADASIQVFFSVGCCWGNFITIGKHNAFRNNLILDAGVLVLTEFITSIFCGCVIFAVLGQMSMQINVPIPEVIDSGPGLAFVIYPSAVMALPVPQLWSVLFFLMLTNLGLGSAIPQLANILVSLTEEIEILSTKRNRLITLICLAAVSFLIGLVYTTNGGIYVLTLMDYYGPPVFLVVIGLLEVVVVAWIYGSGTFLMDLESMTRLKPHYLHFFTVFWRGVCPVTILAVIVSISLNWYTPSYNGYIFPGWANVVGWMLTIVELLPIPVVIIYKLYMTTNRQEMRNLIRPTADWGTQSRQSQNTDIIYSNIEMTKVSMDRGLTTTDHEI